MLQAADAQAAALRRRWLTSRRRWLTPRSRRLVALGAAVTLLHLWLADAVLPPRWGEGVDDKLPRRIEVAFVRQLAQSQPATAPPPIARRVRPAVAAMAAPAASAASAPIALVALVAPEPEPQAEPPQLPVPETLPPLPALAALADPVSAPAAAASAAQTAAAEAFDWPPSTRLSYSLSGNYRGPVEGQARVEWLRAGTRYQVVMDVAIGPAFAPLMTRRVASEGEITPEGLQPRRYDEETRVVLSQPRRRTLFLDPDRVRVPGGREWPRPAGVQDSVSQFVQLTWLFTTQPQLLQTGRSIELPLALPGGVEPWTYDVLAAETLDTPAGAVRTLRVKPRREPRPGGDLTAEFWVAPSLQYLPVRIVIRQDAETWIDLLIERLPEQAERGK